MAKIPLGLDDQPRIGDEVLGIDYRRRDPGVAALEAIRKELVGLRADLYARSWGGRWRRFGRWIASFWRSA